MLKSNRYNKLIQLITFSMLALTAGVANISFAQELLPQDRIAKMVRDFEANKRGVVGAKIIKLSGDMTIYKHKYEELFIPASNQKLLTTAAVLEKYGKDYKFKTKLYQMGEALVLVGDFDPSLGDPILSAKLKCSIYSKFDELAKKAAEKLENKNFKKLIIFTRMKGDKFHPASWKKSHYTKWYGAPVADFFLTTTK